MDCDVALEKINDLIGVRAICSYVDDIYRVTDLLEEQKDLRIVKVKDYIKHPKKSGYQSLHMILDVSDCISERNAVDSCGITAPYSCYGLLVNLDHQLRYKRGEKETDMIDEELQQCAAVITELDQKMLKVRKKIDKI